MARDPEEIRREIDETRSDMGETVEALAYKTDVKGRASNWVSEKKDAVVGTVRGSTPDTDGVKQGVQQGAEGVKEGAQRGVSVARENPLGLAIGGVAVGFLAGLVAPATRKEDEQMGDVADELKERARETGREALERGKHVAQEAGQAASEAAKETGQEQAEGLRESARQSAEDVGQTARQSS